MLAGMFAWLKLRRRVVQFVTPAGKDEPSELAQYIDLCSQVLITRAAVSLTARENNARSLEVRQAKAVDKALITDTLAGVNPVLGILAAKYPNVVKQIAKNQDLLPYILELAGNIKGGSNGHTEQPPISFSQSNMF